MFFNIIVLSVNGTQKNISKGRDGFEVVELKLRMK